MKRRDQEYWNKMALNIKKANPAKDTLDIIEDLMNKLGCCNISVRKIEEYIAQHL